MPAIVFKHGNAGLTLDALRDALDGFDARDDVYSPGFLLGGVLVIEVKTPQEATPTIPQSVQQYRRDSMGAHRQRSLCRGCVSP